MPNDVRMGWLDRIVDLHFGGAFMSVSASGTVRAFTSDPLAPPSIAITPLVSPHDKVSFTQLDHNLNQQRIIIPDQQVPITIFTIWNPCLPVPDQTNYDLVFRAGGNLDFDLSYTGQFMQQHGNIVLKLRTLGVFVNPDGTFNSAEDAAAALPFMSKTTVDLWTGPNGLPVDCGFINNFVATINVTKKVDGSSAASTILNVLYAIPASGAFSVDVSCPGPNPASTCTVSIYTTAKTTIKKLADLNNLVPDAFNSLFFTASHSYAVKFTAPTKNPTVTIS